MVEGWATCPEVVVDLVVSYLHPANPRSSSKLEAGTLADLEEAVTEEANVEEAKTEADAPA